MVDPNDHRLKMDDESDPGYGLTDLIERKVYLDSSMSRETALTVTIHEIQHIIHSVLGVDDDSTEEQVATASGNGWFNVWIENPKLLTWVGRMTREIRRESKIDSSPE